MIKTWFPIYNQRSRKNRRKQRYYHLQPLEGQLTAKTLFQVGATPCIMPEVTIVPLSCSSTRWTLCDFAFSWNSFALKEVDSIPPGGSKLFSSVSFYVFSLYVEVADQSIRCCRRCEPCRISGA